MPRRQADRQFRAGGGGGKEMSSRWPQTHFGALQQTRRGVEHSWRRMRCGHPPNLLPRLAEPPGVL
jgi:hypothetical protein